MAQRGSRRLIPTWVGRQATCRVTPHGAAGTEEFSGLTEGSAPLYGTRSHRESVGSEKEAGTPPKKGVCSSISMELEPLLFLAATHVHHEEAGRLDVAPGHDVAAQQVLASVAEVGELPPEEGDPERCRGEREAMRCEAEHVKPKRSWQQRPDPEGSCGRRACSGSASCPGPAGCRFVLLEPLSCL